MIKPLMERSPYFLMIKKFYLSLVMLCEFRELSKDYIAEMPVKLGLTVSNALDGHV